MKFAKLHGLGNDFLILRGPDIGGTGKKLNLLSEQLCRRRCGIGADGLIVYEPTVGDAEGDVSALIYNADGSMAEMSGNGTRCLAAWLIHCGEILSRSVRIRTVSGVKTFNLQERSDLSYVFQSSLGHPVLDPLKIPVRLGSGAPIIDFPLDAGADTIRITATSMGNPHCSTFWPDLTEAPVESLGPVLERHPAFPHRTNVEFIQVLDRHRIRVRFWERGVGVTPASGTGSAAAAVSAMLNDSVESPVTVELEMGTLAVRWRRSEELLLTGPAEYVCDGNFPLEMES